MQQNLQQFQPNLGNPSLSENIPDIHFDCSDGHALQLVRITNNRNFELVPDTVDYLMKNFDGGIAICSIVGKYRTGKSFLLNRLLDLNQDNGFNVSASINACTKGLWIWSRPIFSQKDNLNIIFMDTEGLDSVDRNSDTDSKLFALTVLISSYFIYNSIGAIDEVSINTLSLITYLIKTVSLEEGKKLVSEYQLSQFAPKLLWILRDFILEIKDPQGRPISANQYLESSLVDVNPSMKSGNKDSQKSIQTRQSLINFFKNRDCMTMVRPIDDENNLRNIQHLSDNQIKPDFLNALNSIRNKIYKNCNQKVINGIGLNANMMIVYLKQFIESFNSGKLPVIQTAWKSLVENECRSNYELAVEAYEAAANQVLDLNSVVDKDAWMKKVEIYKNFGYIRDIALNEYNKCYHIKDRDPESFDRFHLKLKSYIDSREASLLQDYTNKSKHKNVDQLQNLISSFIKSTNPDKYSEEELAEELYNRVFLAYENQNFGGDETQNCSESFQSYSRTIVDWYSNKIKMSSQSRKKDLQRTKTTEAEKLKMETEILKSKKTKVVDAQRELEGLEEKLTQIRSGRGNDRITKLEDELEKLNDKINTLTDIENGKSKELTALNLEVETLTKKKKGC